MKIDRKDFLYQAWKLIIGAWSAILFDGPKLAYSAYRPAGQEDEMTQKTKFIHNWILSLMENMDEHLDEEAKINLLEECGRTCAESHAKAEALKHKGNLDGWLGVFKKWVGPENIQREDDAVRVIYSKCLCPLVQDRPPLMSKTYCNCSRGWLKEVFETVMEKQLEVKLEDSIMQGGKRCQFLVFF
jgi:predicted hydrocarbon binding protein